MIRRIILIFSTVALATCGGKDQRPDDTLVEETPPVDKESEFEHPDPGPILQRAAGNVEPLRHEPVESSVDAAFTDGGYTYVRFETDREQYPAPYADLRVESDAGHGVAFPMMQKAALNAPIVVVRFVGEEPPGSFVVHWSQPAEPAVYGAQGLAGSVGRIEVAVPEKTERDSALETAFWASASVAFEARTRGEAADPFFEFANYRVSLLQPEEEPGVVRRRTRTEVERLMDLYSGMSSIDEALQADRGLRLRGKRADRTIPVSEVEGVPLPGHPWKQMIADLDTAPKVEPLASVVPADMAYLHFDDLRTFVRLLGELDDWVSPFAQWVESRPGASHFLSGYETQLVIERTGLAEMLGHVAVSEMAIVTSDPFLREGTDVSMIFRVKNRTALLGALKGFEANARQRHDDIQESTWKTAGVTVRQISTPDGDVNQHRAEYGEVLVISNSRGAIEHLLSAHEGKLPTLAEAGDFRYMRARYPWGADAEDGFLFLGDRFVAHAVSPAVKILEGRRLSARADLQAINHAALLHGWMEGRHPADAKELRESRYLEEEELEHADGAGIRFEAGRGAQSKWGSPRRLTPIRDLRIEKVTQEEQKAYQRFRETYQDYWRRYVDPIAVRVTRAEDGAKVAFDARMLPLIDATEYDEFQAVVGEQKVLRPEIDSAAQWTFAVGRDARLRKTLDGMVRSTVSREIGVGWLGKWVMLGIADRSGIWDLALLTGQIPQSDGGGNPPWRQVSEQQRRALGHFPLYAGAHVTNKVGLAAVLAGLKKWVEDVAPGMISWGQIEPYREIPIVQITPNADAGPVQDIPGQLALHYATVEDVFVASLERATLELLIDQVLAGGSARPATGPPSSQAAVDAQTFLNVVPGENGWLARTLVGISERGVIENHSRALAAWTVLRRGLPDAELDGNRTRQLGLAYLGYEPRNPNGGEFRTTRTGRPTHTLYGDGVAPKFPELPVKGSPLTRVFAQLEQLTMSLDFEGEGDHRALRSSLEWEWSETD